MNYYNIAQHSTTYNNTSQHGTAQHNTAQHKSSTEIISEQVTGEVGVRMNLLAVIGFKQMQHGFKYSA